jgi:hypothetical protein
LLAGAEPNNRSRGDYGSIAPQMADRESAVLALGDYERLKRIRDRLLNAADWNDLLATP